MYIIGICDDEKGTCGQLEEMIQQYFCQQREKAETEVFYSGSILMQYLANNNKFDLLFLDIDLITSSGIEIGKYVRNILKDEQMEIVYISSKTQYAMELFQCRPMDFLVKPLKFPEVAKVLETMKTRHGVRKKMFIYPSDKTTKRIAAESIMYCMSENKEINMVLCTGEHIRFRGKISSIIEKLPELLFIQIHKSYLINLNYVTEYSSEWVKMTDEKILGISPSKRKEVKTRFMQYEML